MNKITYDEWINSMSLYIDDEFDALFINKENKLTQFIIDNNKQLSNIDGLNNFIFNKDEFSIEIKFKAILCINGISDEKFKRVITNKRISTNDAYVNEYSIAKIIKLSQDNSDFKREILEFLLNGENSTIGKYSPKYFTRQFKLNDSEFISSICDYHFVNRVLSDKELFGKYSNKIGAHIEDKICDVINDLNKTRKTDILYDIQKEHIFLEKNIDIVIDEYSGYEILLESSYSNTTSSDQSKRADQLVNMKKELNTRCNKTLLLNFCDGLGWVNRKKDLKRIYDSSDYVFNLNNLNDLYNILLDIKIN